MNKIIWTEQDANLFMKLYKQKERNEREELVYKFLDAKLALIDTYHLAKQCGNKKPLDNFIVKRCYDTFIMRAKELQEKARVL